MKTQSIVFTVIFVICLQTVTAQSGGNFTINQSVIAAGGQSSAGGNLVVGGSIGQSAAGTNSAGANYVVRGGFWALIPLAPTAANVTVSGRVTTADGLGIRNASIILTDANGLARTAQTATFGYFRFEAVAVGQTYILQISSKKFVFADSTRFLNVQEDIADADFVAESQ